MNNATGKLLADPRWSHVKFLIKANENEQFFLWKEHSDHSNEKGLKWNTVGDSKALVIDHINEKPLSLCITFVKLEDVLVAFYDSPSRVVDWDVVTSWLKEVFKGRWQGNKIAVCGFSTFKDCLRFVNDPKSREVKEETAKSI